MKVTSSSTLSCLSTVTEATREELKVTTIERRSTSSEIKAIKEESEIRWAPQAEELAESPKEGGVEGLEVVGLEGLASTRKGRRTSRIRSGLRRGECSGKPAEDCVRAQPASASTSYRKL